MTKKRPNSAHVEQVIAHFGGIRPMADAMGHKSQSTVQKWKERGNIPYWRHDEIFRAARRKKIKRSIIEAALNGNGRSSRI